jgi:hypothetical protein
LAILFVFLYLVPIAISAGLYYLGGKNVDWRSADPSSTGLLPSPVDNPEAIVRIFSARTVSWRGIVASHSWIVVKDRLAPAYQRFDYTAWASPSGSIGLHRMRDGLAVNPTLSFPLMANERPR